MKEPTITIFIPRGSLGRSSNDSELITFLRDFAEKKSVDEREWPEKYGTDYEDTKTKMHPFCWCEKDECPYCGGKVPLFIKKDTGIEEGHIEAPNFWYKPLNFKVWWYKYIGRDMEINKDISEIEFKQMISDCLELPLNANLIEIE